MSNGLGRGLSSLIPQKVNKVAASPQGEAIVEVSSQADKDRVLRVSPEKININPMQPRKNFPQEDLQELAASIKEYGVIQPLIVTAKNGQFELIAGERRLRAAKILNLAAVPVIIREAKEQEKLELSLVENLQREDLNPIETALAYRKLIDEFSLSQDEVAAKVGRARPTVTNTLRLLNLPEEIQQGIIAGKISFSQAKYVMGLDTEQKQLKLYKKIVQQGLNIEDAVAETRRMGGTKEARIKINYQDKDKELAFREFFGTRVEIKRTKQGGQIIIDFFSDDQLAEMTDKVRGTK